MTFEDIERLVRRLDASNVTAFEASDGAAALTLRFSPEPAAPRRADAPPAADAPEAEAVRARAIGVLRLHHPCGAGVAQTYPRRARAGEILAFLEAGSCLRPVVMERDGTVGAPLHADGAVVGYGTPLFPLLSSTSGKS